MALRHLETIRLLIWLLKCGHRSRAQNGLSGCRDGDAESIPDALGSFTGQAWRLLADGTDPKDALKPRDIPCDTKQRVLLK